MCEATPAIPAPKFLLDNLFDVVCYSGLAQARHNRRRFGDELFDFIGVDADRVKSEQDVDERFVERPVLSSVCTQALLAFSRVHVD